MRVCTANQMSAIDAATIAAGTPGQELMERAGLAMTDHLLDFFEGLEQQAAVPGRALIICGKGNNGGDGLVVARYLCEADLSVAVMMLADREQLTPDTRLNYDRLPAGVDVLHPARDHWISAVGPLLAEAAVVVDAIFGTGITPPLQEPYVGLINTINDSGVPSVALDIPSGVNGDDGVVNPVALAADLTITVGLPKRGLLLAPGRDFTGEVEVVDIGFPADICAEHSPNHHWLSRYDYLGLLPPRTTHCHKYDFGRLVILAGSRAYGGAAHLAGLGALRSGVGLVKVAVPMELVESIRVGLPETLAVGLATTETGTIGAVPSDMMENLLESQNALVLGPGLGSHPETDAWVTGFLGQLACPAVVDADGLGAFSRTGCQPRFGSDQVILTPHAGELGRLLGMKSSEVEARRFELLPELAARWGVVLMLKGSPSLIAAPDGRLFFNTSGDDALAKGGSGDALSGLLGGLLAQGISALEAALLGAYVHGLAGTLAAGTSSPRSVLVREIANAMGPVFGAMEKEASSHAVLRQKLWPVISKEVE
jgi:ADP-dependent NAD(P)H-hydrate dehydratase / NAD(P)H-hydrate epimerase